MRKQAAYLTVIYGACSLSAGGVRVLCAEQAV